MRTVLKVFAVLVVLGIVAIAGVVLWWKAYSARLLAEADAVKAEATNFGETTDNAGCLTAGLVRSHDCDGLFCEVQAAVFLRTCLEASQPTEGFCDGVPPKTISEVMATVRWAAVVCEAESYPEDEGCVHVVSQVQQFCHPTEP